MAATRRSIRLALTALWILSLGWASAVAHGVTPVSAKVGEPAVNLGPYLLTQKMGYVLRPVDPQTLQDTRAVPAIKLGGKTFGAYTAPNIVTSPDGSVVAAVYYLATSSSTLRARNYTILLRDLLSGARRGPAFHPRVPIDIQTVSSDGRTLAGFRATQSGKPIEWDTIAAYTGRVISRMRLPTSPGSQWQYDAQAGRLYTLDEPATTAAAGFQAPTLTGYDLSTGTEIARLQLTGIKAGWWRSPASSSNDPSVTSLSAGFALSPDGSRIAVIDPSSEAVTLIDAAQMKIVSTRALTRSQSVLSRLAAWTGLAATPAEAKQITGVALQARFSPDGRLVYVTGTSWSPDAQGNTVSQGLGLRAIDVATGQLVAEALPGTSVNWAMPGPGGNALYVGTWKADGSCPCMLSRLDGSTLAVTAQRSFQYTMPSLYSFG